MMDILDKVVNEFPYTLKTSALLELDRLSSFGIKTLVGMIYRGLTMRELITKCELSHYEELITASTVAMSKVRYHRDKRHRWIIHDQETIEQHGEPVLRVCLIKQLRWSPARPDFDKKDDKSIPPSSSYVAETPFGDYTVSHLPSGKFFISMRLISHVVTMDTLVDAFCFAEDDWFRRMEEATDVVAYWNNEEAVAATSVMLPENPSEVNRK